MSLNLGFGSINLGHSGSAPSPFDAINGPRLAGGEGSHPLHSVTLEELVRASDGAVVGQFALDRQPRVAEGITGTLRLQAQERVEGHKAYLRLVGLRLDEVRKSEDHHDSEGRTTYTERWVECHGKLFVADAFLDPSIPATMEPGQTYEAPFAIPAPQLGPPSAHLGESLVGWALEVRWDVSMGRDHFVACYLPLAQHPDLLRAGVGKQGGQSMMQNLQAGDGWIAVLSPLPATPGEEMEIQACWPSASGGSKARIELHRRTNAPNGCEGIVASAQIDPSTLPAGAAGARLLIPAGSAPSFDGAGLEIQYVIRVLVDRRFRPDAAIERPVAVC